MGKSRTGSSSRKSGTDLVPRASSRPATSRLRVDKVPFDSSSVLWAMDAVFQSNSTGVLLSQPYRCDPANIETIPAYMLATGLFQNAMRNATGYWITSLDDANMTSIDYADGKLTIKVVGDDGVLCLGTPGGAVTCSNVNGVEVLMYGSSQVASYWALPWARFPS